VVLWDQEEKMGTKLLVVIFLANIRCAFGALPPLYQSTRDLTQIIHLIEGLGDVTLTVKSVDLESFTANMQASEPCQIIFQRKKGEGDRPGPMPSLEIKSNYCK